MRASPVFDLYSSRVRADVRMMFSWKRFPASLPFWIALFAVCPLIGVVAMTHAAGTAPIWFIFGGTSACMFIAALQLRRRQWRLVDIPTVDIAGVIPGLCEVQGIAASQAPVIAPGSRQPVVWYRWRMEEKRNLAGRTEWRTVAKETSTAPFLLRDGTGEVKVLPRGADFTGFQAHEYSVPGRSRSEFRQFEERIGVASPLFVLGPVALDPTGSVPYFMGSRRSEEFLISPQTERRLGRNFGIASAFTSLVGCGLLIVAHIATIRTGVDATGKPTMTVGLIRPLATLGPRIAMATVL